MEKGVLLKCKLALEDPGSRNADRVQHDVGGSAFRPQEAQFQSHLGSFLSGALETHDDFS